MDPRLALQFAGGAARRDGVLNLGVSEFALRSALVTGQVVRPVRGTYALPGTRPELVVAASLRGQLSCVSACHHWGLKSLSAPDRPHILVPYDRHPQDERFERLRIPGVHRDDGFEPGRLIQPVALAVDHAARCTTPLEQLVLLDSALYKRLLDPLEQPVLSTSAPEREAWLLANMNRFTQSPAETVGRALLTAAGFDPQPQQWHDNVGHVDFGVGARHVTEIDGFEFHSKEEAFEEDRRRDRELAAAGKVPIRFPAKVVFNDPRGFIQEVSRVTHIPVDARFEGRLRWMTSMPFGHLNRRQQSRVHA